MVRVRSRSLLLALVAVTTVGAIACTPPPSPPEGAAPGELLRSSLAFDESPAVPDEDMAALADGQLALATDLLAGMEGNASLSPLSISAAFSMLSAGARGETLEEVEAGLHLLPQEQLHLVQNALELALRDRDVAPSDEHDGVTLAQANQLFSALDFHAEDAFLDVLAQRYDAGLRLLDFQGAPEASREAINAWVADVTREKIEDLLPEGIIDPATRLVLVNALYLNAAWQTAFEASNTAPAPFFLADGEEVEVPTMRGVVEGRHGVVGDVELVELPFVGGELAFVIALPGDDVSEAEAIAALGERSLSGASLQLSLPKFSVRSELDLRPALEALGVSTLFTGACDLSGINPDEDLFVTGAVHEAVVEVDEKGVEAAAATAIVVGRDSSIGLDPVTVTVDKPFVFAIVDRATAVPLFVGRVLDPR